MNTGVIGTPGGGKTEGQIARVLADAIGGKKAVVVNDPQANLCIRLMMYLLSFLKRVYYICIRDIDRTLGFINLKRSTNPNPLKRMQEDREHRMLIARLFLGRRGLDPTLSPLIWEWLEWGLRLIQYSDSPLYWLPYCFQPTSTRFLWMLKNCSDVETVDRFQPVQSWSPTKVRQELSPALRVVETVCLDPAFIGACGNFDLEQALREKKIIIVEGQGANRETVRTISLFVMLLTIQFSEREKSPVHLVVDEVENFDLLTPDVLVGINTLRKQDFDLTLITQSLGFDETTFHKLMQAIQRWEVFRCGPEVARIASKIMGTPQIRRDEVSHTESRNRQIHAGYSEIEGRLISEYADVTEDVNRYLSFSDQVREYEKFLMTLNVGERYVNHYGRVFKEKVRMLAEPYPWGLSQSKVEAAIQWIQQKPEYRIPELIGVPESFLSAISSTRTRQPSGKASGGGKRKSAAQRIKSKQKGRSRNV